MAYNKKAHLRQNIDAIKIAFALEKEKRLPTPDETMALYKYSDFGALKEVIDTRPMERDNLDPQSMTGMYAELHQVLKENTADEKQYKKYFDGIKNSILTAYYTPGIIPHTIAQEMNRIGITADRILDPSAGTGVFGHNQHIFNPESEITFFEKEPVTGLILKYLRPDTNVRIQGFETIEPRYNSYFDLAASNIPFGDVALFDPAFSTSTDATRR